MFYRLGLKFNLAIFEIPVKQKTSSFSLKSMVFIHRVAVKSYLKKYMAHYVKVEPQFRLTDTNKFGGFLINSLRHKKHIKPSELKLKVEGTCIMVAIPEYYEKNFGVCISKTAQYRFGKFLYDDFNDRLLDYVLPRITGVKGDIRRELLNFRNKYYITEDELPFFSLKRQYERAVIELNNCKSA